MGESRLAPRKGLSGLPERLKLHFSSAADSARINRMFDPDVKKRIDPKGNVIRRSEEMFSEAVETGSAVFLVNPDMLVRPPKEKQKPAGALTNITTETPDDLTDPGIYCITMGYSAYEPHNDDEESYCPDAIEIGTSLSSLPGFSAVKYVIAALTLREWWHNKPNNKIVTKIKKDNAPAIHTYGNSLAWEKITDTDDHAKLCDLYDIDEDAAALRDWFYASASTLKKCADVILSALQPHEIDGTLCLSRGQLVNKRTQQTLDIDFSALEEEGLCIERLQAISGGITNKRKLMRNIPC